MPDRKMVMNKADAVRIMTDRIEAMNIEMAKAQGMDENMIKLQISHMRKEIERVNSLIFDSLNEKGYIVPLAPTGGW